MFILVAYDIAQPKRLRKVALTLEDYGTRVQRSLFECLVDGSHMVRLAHELRLIIDDQEDSVRYYRLCQTCQNSLYILGQGATTSDPDLYII